MNQIITLTSSTGFHALAKKPPAGYPETYFGRMPLPQEAVMAVIAACRSDDIYHQVCPPTLLNTLLTCQKHTHQATGVDFLCVHQGQPC